MGALAKSGVRVRMLPNDNGTLERWHRPGYRSGKCRSAIRTSGGRERRSGAGSGERRAGGSG